MQEFMDFMVEILSKHKNSTILGDFNLHINYYADNETMVFSDIDDLSRPKTTCEILHT